MGCKVLFIIFYFRLQFILDSGAIRRVDFDEFLKSKQHIPSASLISLKEIAESLLVQIGINIQPSVYRLLEEMELFLQTGDFEPKTFKVCCLNPTLLTLDEQIWQVIIPCII